MYIATFLSPSFDEGGHEDIVGNTANLTNVDVNRQSTKIVEEISEIITTVIQVFFHRETVLSNLRKHRHDQDSSTFTSAPESSHTSLVQQARETQPRCSCVHGET